MSARVISYTSNDDRIKWGRRGISSPWLSGGDLGSRGDNRSCRLRGIVNVRGLPTGSMLSSMGTVKGLPSHFSAGLDAEVGKVTSLLAVSANRTGFALCLGSKDSGALWCLFGMMTYEFILLEEAVDN